MTVQRAADAASAWGRLKQLDKNWQTLFVVKVLKSIALILTLSELTFKRSMLEANLQQVGQMACWKKSTHLVINYCTHCEGVKYAKFCKVAHSRM